MACRRQSSLPSPRKFAGTLFATAWEKELALQCTHAWNDFVVEGWFAPYPGRLIPMVVQPFREVETSVEEVEHLPRGLRAVSVPDNLVLLGLAYSHFPESNRIGCALKVKIIVMCLYFGVLGKLLVTPPEARVAVMKCAFAEGEIDLIPYTLEHTESTWERQRSHQNVNQEKRPTEIFNEHIFGYVLTDFHTACNRHAIGTGWLTCERDYPHSDSNWPKSRQYATTMFTDVPKSEMQQIVEWIARVPFRFLRTKGR